MEFVGRTVRKDFKGFGVFSGVVKSYDSSSGFFEIGYEDGDSEEIEFSELASLFNEDGGLGDHSQSHFFERPSRVGRKPKKRRRVLGSSNSGNENDSSSPPNADGHLDSIVQGELRYDGTVVGNLTKNLDFSCNNGNSSCENLNLNAGGLDLNRGLDDLNANVRENVDGLDLNLDLNEEEDDWESKGLGLVDSSKKKERCFDLNMEMDEDESKNQDVDLGGYLKGSCEESHKTEKCGGEDAKTQIEGASLNASHLDVSGGTDPHGNHSSIGGVAAESQGDLDANFLNKWNSSDNRTSNVSTAILDYQGTPGKAHTGGRRGRKRRNLSDSGYSAAESVLRRSSRRRAKFSAEDHVPNAIRHDVADSLLPSPAISAVSEDQPTFSGCEESEEPIILPSKLELPPSSGNINLDGFPALDLFSVYAFLRSFSNLLFLSPFGLGDFVASLRTKSPSLLIDSIHVSLLQALRRHLQSQTDESSPSATNCLRDLNWDLLDVITWPIFMIEYLLMKPGFDLCNLKMFKTNYYKQPEFVKVEILQYLCDDVIEVEAISSELSRRTLVGGPVTIMDSDRSTKLVASKKRRAIMDISGSSCMAEEVIDETADWNSDECCLCKMDGNLICCDGCPAAFHSKCVGVATNLLPEGDWYCPECVVDRENPGMNVGKSTRGAELLGVDPHGRLYYISCGYLLVSDPCDAETSFHYYHMNDLTAVIEALNLLNGPYITISRAITKHWDLYKKLYGQKSNMHSENSPLCVESLAKGHMSRTHMALVPRESSETCAKDETLAEEKPELCMLSTYASNVGCHVSDLVNVGPLAASSAKLEKPLAHSTRSPEISEADADVQNSLKPKLDCLNESSGVMQKPAFVGDPSLTTSDLNVEQGKNVDSSNNSCHLSKITTRKGMSEQLVTDYVNLYSFARVASSVAGAWTRKALDKVSQKPTKTLEELISTQMKAISNTSVDFCWSNIQNLTVDARKEKCGWCLACKFPTDDGNCLFVMNNTTVLEGFTSDLLGLTSRRIRKDRLVDAMCHILSIEDRLHGLLLGPWLNPHFAKIYRKCFFGISDISPAKNMLLMLESNIRALALSSEWLKHVDSMVTVGSASHVVISSLRVPSRGVIGRKRSRCSDSEPRSSKNASSGLGLFWWRGGRLTRQLFNWKVLPRSLASKAARQGGNRKIEGILYPENSDFAKRSKSLAWRASVESSVTVEQLALQVRELDANIRWDEIENTSHLAKMDKESIKSMRSFKKAIIRRKSQEGAVLKYLLDFGKRRFIPDTVVKHGSKLEESSSERKKYWLEEPYVPLFLLKAFEERRIAIKSNMKSPGDLAVSRSVKKPFNEVGFSYLFSKAEKSENYQCGHCNKDVLIREAISCQYCEGFFHKRHVRKTSGAITAKCTYTCHKCHGRNHVNVVMPKGKLHSRKGKKASKVLKPVQSKITRKNGKGKQPVQPQTKSQTRKSVVVVVPLRRSARKAKVVSLQSKKTEVKKRKKPKSTGKMKQLKSADEPKRKRGRPRKPKKDILQKKRTQVHATYWLNGLLLSRKPDDERVTHFRTRNHLVPFESSAAVSDQPKCCLCHEPEFRPLLNYISCEICGDWYHGDAFGLKVEHIGMVIGFKCHKCRNRTPPICPHLRAVSDDSKLDEGPQCADEVLNEVLVKQNSATFEESKDLFWSDKASQKEPHGPESAVLEKNRETENSGTMNLGPTDTLIEPTESSSSKDVLLASILVEAESTMPDQYKDVLEKENSSTHNLINSGALSSESEILQQEATVGSGELLDR